MRFSQAQIDKFFKIINWSLRGIFLAGFVLLFFIHGIWFIWFAGSTILVLILVEFFARRFATNEETEEFKRTVKEAVREMHDERIKTKPIYSDAVKNPLIGLNPQETTKVIELLNQIQVENGHIRTSELMAFIRALKAGSHLDDSDLDNVVCWVEQVTGESVDKAHFKSEYSYRPSQKNIDKMCDFIKDELRNLR